MPDCHKLAAPTQGQRGHGTYRDEPETGASLRGPRRRDGEELRGQLFQPPPKLQLYRPGHAGIRFMFRNTDPGDARKHVSLRQLVLTIGSVHVSPWSQIHGPLPQQGRLQIGILQQR